MFLFFCFSCIFCSSLWRIAVARMRLCICISRCRIRLYTYWYVLFLFFARFSCRIGLKMKVLWTTTDMWMSSNALHRSPFYCRTKSFIFAKFFGIKAVRFYISASSTSSGIIQQQANKKYIFFLFRFLSTFILTMKTIVSKIENKKKIILLRYIHAVDSRRL